MFLHVCVRSSERQKQRDSQVENTSGISISVILYFLVLFLTTFFTLSERHKGLALPVKKIFSTINNFSLLKILSSRQRAQICTLLSIQIFQMTIKSACCMYYM